MIVAVEGPRASGKSTVAAALLKALPGARLLAYPHRHDGSYRAYPAQERAAETFAMLYDPASAVVADRFWPCSSAVWASLARLEPPPFLEKFSSLFSEAYTVVLLPRASDVIGRLLRRGCACARASVRDVELEIDAYERWARAHSGERVSVVPASRPIEEVVSAARAAAARAAAASAGAAREGRYDLRRLIEVQRVFNEELQRVKHGRSLAGLTPEARNAALGALVLSAIRELTELLERTDWKMHRRGGRPVEPERALEEFVDAFKFVLNFFVYVPFGVDAFLDEFSRKSAVVAARLREEFGA